MWPFRSTSNDLIQQISAPLKHTPDKALLVDGQFKLVFVCDDMMRAHKNYSLIKEHSAKVSRGFTRHPFDYRIGKHTGRGLPFMDKAGLKIKGELHAVESQHIIELDKRYKNGVEFARCRVDILAVDRAHQLMHIGDEAFVKNLPPGMIRTVPELQLRHYISDQFVCIIKAYMYIAIKKHWAESPKEEASYPTVPVVFPKDPTVWLPKYFKYPINRNR